MMHTDCFYLCKDDDKALWQLSNCPVYSHVSSSSEFQYSSTTVPKDDGSYCQVTCISLYIYMATATGKKVNVVVTHVIVGTDLYNYCY